MHIFAEQRLSDLLAAASAHLKDAIDSESDSHLLSVDEDEYVKQMAARFAVEELNLQLDDVYVTEYEALIPAERHPSTRFHVRRGESYPRQVLVFHLPFSGNSDLLGLTPNTRLLWSHEVSVEAGEIKFELINFLNDADDMNRKADDVIGNMSKQLANVIAEVRQYNLVLEAQARQLFNRQKQRIEKKSELLKEIKFPVKRQGDSREQLVSPESIPSSSATITEELPVSSPPSFPPSDAEHPCSVFISYGAPDEPFAGRLNDALQQQGVKTFFFSQHAIPGQKLHRLMREGVNTYDRVILICSTNSLDRPGVVNELEETLQREAREGGRSILIPITLDDYVFTDWAPDHPDIAQAVRDRVVADFRDTSGSQDKFDAALDRLMKGIETSG